MKKKDEYSYNERLFSGGFRKKLHLARFKWLHDSVANLCSDVTSVVELGCYDGKVLDYLPYMPDRYLGLDANWEDGLTIARKRYADMDGVQFLECKRASEIDSGNNFDIAISMETFEHIAPVERKKYLEALSHITRECVFITVPKEIGVVFVAKNLIKILFGDSIKYSFRDFFFQTFGLTKSVNVNKGGHKGFNYKQFLHDVSEYFEIDQVVGAPLAMLPTILNFNVCIIARPKVL